MEKVLANRYALEAEIDRGAIGTVWRARDLTTGEPVAVKVLLPETEHDADVVQSLLDEAEILSQLDHPSIVRPRDFVANGLRALVMDLVEGADVRKKLRTSGPLRPAEVAQIAVQIADALAAVHTAGMLHGDVKPGNIMVPSNGGPAKLVDFGVARRVQLPDTVTHATPEYVAPEVVAGASPTPAADVYSMGMVIYEMASARSPYRGGSVREVVDRHATCVPVQPAGMPDELWQVVRHCVELDPGRRPTAEQLAAQLRALAPSLIGRPPAVRLPEYATTYRPRLADPGASDPGAVGASGVASSSDVAGSSGVAGLSGPEAASVSAGPASAVPMSGLPVSAMPASGSPVSSGPVSAGPVPGEPISPAPVGSGPVGEDRSLLALFDRTQDEATRVVPPGALPPGVFPEPAPAGSGKGKAFAYVGVAAALMLLLGLGAAFLIWSGSGSGTHEATEPKPAPSSEAPTSKPSPTPSDEPSPSESPSSESPTEQPPAQGGDGSGADGGNGSGPGDGSGDGGSGNGRPGIGDRMPTMPGT